MTEFKKVVLPNNDGSIGLESQNLPEKVKDTTRDNIQEAVKQHDFSLPDESLAGLLRFQQNGKK